MTVYFPGSQFFFFAPSALVVRTSGEASALVPTIRDAIRVSAPRAAIQSVETMDSLLAQELSRPRVALAVTMLFALMAIALAVVGVYGVLSYETRQRQRELAVRSAVGASPKQIFRSVIGRSAAVGAMGTAIGLAGALAATRGMRAILFEVDAADPATFAIGAVALFGIVLMAAYRPARRAAMADPVTALRIE
jgi:ABC-type antimicrobial peptide transport system permease subunit